MVIVLGLITALTSLLLAYVFTVTEEPINIAKQQKLNNAIAEVVPGLTSFNESTVACTDGDLTFYDALDENGKSIGTAVKSFDNNGFNGTVVIMVGFDTIGNVIKTIPLEQKETPGLGDKMDVKKSDFTQQFDGVNTRNFIFKVKKDKGDVDAITAATISSRAYCNALQRAVAAYQAEKGETE